MAASGAEAGPEAAGAEPALAGGRTWSHQLWQPPRQLHPKPAAGLVRAAVC